MDPVCLGNISKDLSVDNMKKTEFTGYVDDFSVDYDHTAVNDIENTDKYLMKKNMCKYISCNKENVSIYDYVYQKKIINHI